MDFKRNTSTYRKSAFFVLAAFLCLVVSAVAAVSSDSSGLLRVKWIGNGTEKTLKSWTADELRGRKQVVQHELDPASGKVIRWEGTLFSEFVVEVTQSLSVEEKSNIDLILLRSGSGKVVRIPRAFLNKYPVLLAHNKAGRDLMDKKSVQIVVPWTSHESVKREKLPIERYFVSGVKEIVLTSYGKHFGRNVFLKKRTNPTLIRGEKHFVRACLGCHSPKDWKSPDELVKKVKGVDVNSKYHSKVQGVPSFDNSDQEALWKFIRALARDRNRMAGNKQFWIF